MDYDQKLVTTKNMLCQQALEIKKTTKTKKQFLNPPMGNKPNHEKEWARNHWHVKIIKFKTSTKSALVLFSIDHNQLRHQAPMKKKTSLKYECTNYLEAKASANFMGPR